MLFRKWKMYKQPETQGLHVIVEMGTVGTCHGGTEKNEFFTTEVAPVWR